ncbi:uncharacterized protein LOC129316457 [Prosopis cineraria]|uniref:uncharacterized protein LOC129316457 n=1 Tax=Prosopis cineraria TaxID=364024 RepID=UPI00240F69FB|nr:uncharacterized protein LOC129316457 [Prosopis cineraria]
MNRQISPPFLMIMMTMTMMMMVQADLSRATSSEKVNGSFTTACGHGSFDCVVGDDLEMEFPVDSRVARMLYDISQSTTSRTSNANQASVNCPQNQGYRSCLPSSNGGAPRQRCGDYTRSC